MDDQKCNIVPPIQITALTTDSSWMGTSIGMVSNSLDNGPGFLSSTAPGRCHPVVPSSDGDLEGTSNYSEIMNTASRLGYTNFRIEDFLTVLEDSKKASAAYISSVELYAETVGVHHRYVILHVKPNDKRNKQILYVRLDRRRDHKENILSFAFRFSTSKASDGAWVSGNPENLHVYDKKLERTLSFKKRVPFHVMAPLLEIVEEKSASYHLKDENCWFFASIIQEILALNFAGVFKEKTLKHWDWAPDCRKEIKKKCYDDPRISDQTPVAAKDLNQLFYTIRDPDLRTNSARVIDVLFRQHRDLYESPFHQAKDHLELSTAIKTVFRKLSLLLSEGLYDMVGSVSATKLAKGLETCLKTRESTGNRSLFSRPGDDQVLPFVEEAERFLDSQFNTLDCTQPVGSGELDLSERHMLLMLEELIQCDRANQLPLSWRFRTNEDIGSVLQSEFKRILPEHVLSTCLNWYSILCQSKPTDKILQALMTVLESYLPQWMSVMGAFGQAADIYEGLWRVRQWIIDTGLRGHPGFKLLDNACRAAIGRVRTLAVCSLSILSPSPPWVAAADRLRTPTESGVLWRFAAKMTYSPDEWSPLIATVIHPRRVRSVAFSPTSSHLVSGTDDGAVRVWPVTEEPLAIYPGPTIGVSSVGFSPKGDTMAAAFDNGEIQAWDVATGTRRLSIKAHEDEVQSIAFSRSGSHLASSSNDETIHIWNIEDKSCSHRLIGHTNSVRSVSFSADDTHVYSASKDGKIRVWSAKNGELEQELERDGPSTGVQSMACSAEGSLLASAHDDGWIYIWNVKDGKFKVRIHAACVTSVIFSLDGEVLASASDDGSIRLWDTFDGTHLLTLQGHRGAVTSVAFSSDGKQLVSSSTDRTVRVWDVVIRRHLVTHHGHTSEVLGIRFSENGTRTATISRDSVCVWQTMTGVCILGFQGHIPNPNLLAFSSNGTSLAFVMADQSICVRDAAGGAQRLILRLEKPVSPVRSMLFSPKDTLLASIYENASFSIWDVASGKLKTTLKGDTIAFSFDDKYIASISDDATVRLWDTEHWQDHKLDLPEQVRADITSLGRSPDEHESLARAMRINVSDTSTGATISSISHPSRGAPMWDPLRGVQVEENRVYVVQDGKKMTLCWLPDHWIPGVLGQYRDYAFLGGKSGEVLFVNVGSISFPKD